MCLDIGGYRSIGASEHRSIGVWVEEIEDYCDSTSVDMIDKGVFQEWVCLGLVTFETE
jgi:hypothetical protein